MKKYLLLLVLFGMFIVSQAQQQKTKVAVLDPTTSGVSKDVGLAVQELISSTFVNTGRYIVIERSMIDKIIKEQSFQNSDLADNSQATEIGRIAGANKVVLSSISKVGEKTLISVKIIDVKTAYIDQQQVKDVPSDKLLEVVNPLTLSLLGENATFAFDETNTNQVQSSASMYSTANSPKSNIDYNKVDKEIRQLVSKGVDIAKSTSNPKLSKLIAEGKIQTQFTLTRGLSAEITDAGVLSITGSGEMVDADQKILSPVKPYTTAIVIEEGVTKICAFSSFSNVQYVLLPNTLRVIDENCFNSCSNIMSVNIPSKVTRIGKNAFRNCKNIINLALPNSVEHLGVGAFSGCENLGSINIPTSVTIISESLFKGCKSLREMYIPTNITTIGKDAFANCKSIQKLYIPDNVVSIGEAAFQNMRDLYEIRLSEYISLIPVKAFDNCRSLVNVTCPASVRKVEAGAFSDCSQLIQITFFADNLVSLGKNCFDDCDNLALIVLHSLRPPTCDNIFGNDKNVFSRVTISVPNTVSDIYKKADFWEDFNAISSFD